MEANGSKLIELLEVGYSDDVSGEKEKRKPRVSSFVEELPPTDNSIATSIFLVLNTMIGSGILNQPAVFQDAGIVGAVILYIIGAICTYLGILVLVECADVINIYDYERLVHAALGDWGEFLLLVAIFWGGFGALISYILVIGGTSSGLLHAWECDSDGCSVYTTTIVLVPIFVLPFCLWRHFGHLGPLSWFSITAILLVTLYVMIAGPIIGGPEHTDDYGRTRAIGIGALTKIGSVVYSMGCAPAVLHIYNATKDRNIRIWQTISRRSILLGVIMLSTMGIFGYASFGDATDGEILENFSGTHSSDAFNILLVVHLILYIPVDFVIMRGAFQKLSRIGGTLRSSELVDGKKQVYLPAEIHAPMTVLLLAATCAVSLLLRYGGLTKGQAFSLVLDLTGGIAIAATSFVFPGLTYLKLRAQGRLEGGSRLPKLGGATLAMTIAGSVILVLVPLTIILSAADVIED